MGKYAYSMGNEPLKVGWIFPGQGSQYIGMGKDLYEQSNLARDLCKIADDILDELISDEDDLVLS